MRYLILSDIHANLEALDAVMADARRLGFDSVICLGDLVGYGASPGEVIDAIVGMTPAGLIRGNHDKVCAGIEPPTNFNDAARAAAEWTHRALGPEQLSRLQALPKGPLAIGSDVEICHGSPFDEDFYIFDEGDAGRALAATTADVCFFGHTHVPAIFATSGDAATAPPQSDDELVLPATGRALINVGSVGQPRDGDPRAAYGIYDVERRAVRMRRVVYDVGAAQRRILDAGLPEWLAVRLARGR